MEHSRRRHTALAVGVVGLLALAACSGGDGATSLGAVPTAPTTAAGEVVTTTTASGPSSTTAPTTKRAPTTTAATAVPRVNGIPQVKVTPSRAPVGARVTIDGSGFTEEHWKAAQPPLWLAASTGCNAFADAEHSVTVSASGRLTGSFVVPARANCRQSDTTTAVGPGSYSIVFACTPCTIGRFEVTSNAVECADIGFTPNSDDLASDIVATGLGCAEAEALVRKVGPQVGAVGGPSRVEADGFVCVRTSQDDGTRGLPSSQFACTSGPKKVTFHRT